MPAAPLPIDETDRLAALRRHAEAGEGIDPALQSIASCAAELLDVPIALVSLVDADRQFFKACVGLEGIEGTPRDQAFCAHAILDDEILEVADARLDPRFRDNPLVTGEPRIRFYAGAPVVSGDGHRLGTLCLIDREPRVLEADQRSVLRRLAASASDVLDKMRALRAANGRLSQALADAEEASRAKSAFLATMSHELRTPLNAVIGFAEVLESECFGAMPDPRYTEYVRDIRASGIHLLDLINDILDVCKLDAGKARLYPERLDVGEELDWVAKMVRGQVEKTGARLQVATDPDLPEPHFDRRALRQILLNLTTNAIKYGGEGVRVRVSAVARDDGMDIRVADDGPGIPEDFQGRMFEPFSRADSGPCRATEGTGLGLALCKCLIDAGGGEIEVDSTPGRGTTVRVRLPLHAEAPACQDATNVRTLDDARAERALTGS